MYMYMASFHPQYFFSARNHHRSTIGLTAISRLLDVPCREHARGLVTRVNQQLHHVSGTPFLQRYGMKVRTSLPLFTD